VARGDGAAWTWAVVALRLLVLLVFGRDDGGDSRLKMDGLMEVVVELRRRFGVGGGVGLLVAC